MCLSPSTLLLLSARALQLAVRLCPDSRHQADVPVGTSRCHGRQWHQHKVNFTAAHLHRRQTHFETQRSESSKIWFGVAPLTGDARPPSPKHKWAGLRAPGWRQRRPQFKSGSSHPVTAVERGSQVIQMISRWNNLNTERSNWNNWTFGVTLHHVVPGQPTREEFYHYRHYYYFYYVSFKLGSAQPEVALELAVVQVPIVDSGTQKRPRHLASRR